MIFPPELLVSRYLGAAGTKLWDKSPDDLIKANPDRVYLFRAHLFLRRENIWVGDIDFSDPGYVHNLKAFSAAIRRNVVIAKIADVMVEKDGELSVVRPFATVLPNGKIMWNPDFAISYRFNEDGVPVYLPECLDDYFGMLRKKAAHPVPPVVRTPTYIRQIPFLDWHLLKDLKKDPFTKFYEMMGKTLGVDANELFPEHMVVSSGMARKLNMMFIEWMETYHTDGGKEDTFRLARAAIKAMQPNIGLWLSIKDNMVYYMGQQGELR